MADPVSNMEIEDVLSSIRRLVSEEARTPIREPAGPSFESDVPPQAVELVEEDTVEPVAEDVMAPTPALVLTEALRVEDVQHDTDENESGEAPVEQGDVSERSPLLILRNGDQREESSQENFDDSVPAENVEAPFEFVSARAEPMAEPMSDVDVERQDTAETPDGLLMPEQGAMYHDAMEEQDTLQWAVPEDAAQHDNVQEQNVEGDVDAQTSEQAFETPSEGETDPAAFGSTTIRPPAGAPISIEDKIAALEALINHSESEFEADGSEDGANAARREHALPWEDNSEVIETEQGADFPDPDAASQSAVFDDMPEMDAVPEFTEAHDMPAVESLEELQNTGIDHDSPETDDIPAAADMAELDMADMTGAPAILETPLTPDDAFAFQQAHSEAVETAQSELEQSAAETLLEDDDLGAVLDEEALRDMVAEIVREELQGPLGERITRNVRKLVRREIYRALSANELD